VVAANEKVAANAKNAQKSKKNMRFYRKIGLAATLFLLPPPKISLFYWDFERLVVEWQPKSMLFRPQKYAVLHMKVCCLLGVG